MTNSLPGFYTRKEAADYVGLSVIRLIQLAGTGELQPSRTIGRMVFYDKATLDGFMSKRAGRDNLVYQGERVYTIEQVAEMLGVSRATIHTRVRQHKIESIRQRIGERRWRYMIPARALQVQE